MKKTDLKRLSNYLHARGVEMTQDQLRWIWEENGRTFVHYMNDICLATMRHVVNGDRDYLSSILKIIKESKRG